MDTSLYETYMRRALRLAANGEGFVSPNPLVGAVIADPLGRLIGQGWHRRFGGPHAEVQAVRSVRPGDRALLREATMFVTLEPCSHYGKTPPCARLIIDTGIPRVVVGADDPFREVAGRGIRMLREAGCEVVTGVLRRECEEINATFMTAHRLGRPFVLLKWAESADGFIAPPASGDGRRAVFSNALSMTAMHRLRASADAIMVGINTVLADRPRLDARLWPCRDPETRPLRVSRESERLPEGFATCLRRRDEPLDAFLRRLYADFKVTSLMVEGGGEVLREFTGSGLFDAIRRETSPLPLREGIRAPRIPYPSDSADPRPLRLHDTADCRGNIIEYYSRPLPE